MITLDKVMELTHSELSNLVFGQHHAGTEPFFLDALGNYHSVPLAKFPHYQYLSQNHADVGCEYDRYLSASWAYRYGASGNTPERRWAKMESFSGLVKMAQARHKDGLHPFPEPIQICRRPDGRWIVVDGNHRAAIAFYFELPILAVAVSAKSYLGSIARVPEARYGSARLDMPYQSLYLDGREIVEGRRRDIQERMDMIDDLEGATVIDLGCNIGASSFLAAERGAREVIGFDVNPRLVSAALALNAYFAAPCRFYVHDLNSGAPEDIEPADTVFCFSIAQHVKRRENLREALTSLTRKVLYFEGHARTKLSDYDDLLPRDEFTRIDLLGFLPEAVDMPDRTRPLFRCERRSEGGGSR